MAGGRLWSIVVPSVFMPGALWMAGALGFSTGLVGPVLEPMVPAKEAADKRAVRTRAVNLDRVMVVSPASRVLT
ncbi:hypothetical protein D9M71_330660 [compost metagenome]